MAAENKTRNNGSKLRFYTLENTKAEMVHHKFRDFSFMKVMFLFPVYMSMIYLFAEGIKNLKHHRLVNGLLITAVILYQINFAYLLRALL